MKFAYIYIILLVLLFSLNLQAQNKKKLQGICDSLTLEQGVLGARTESLKRDSMNTMFNMVDERKEIATYRDSIKYVNALLKKDTFSYLLLHKKATYEIRIEIQEGVLENQKANLVKDRKALREATNEFLRVTGMMAKLNCARILNERSIYDDIDTNSKLPRHLQRAMILNNRSWDYTQSPGRRAYGYFRAPDTTKTREQIDADYARMINGMADTVFVNCKETKQNYDTYIADADQLSSKLNRLKDSINVQNEMIDVAGKKLDKKGNTPGQVQALNQVIADAGLHKADLSEVAGEIEPKLDRIRARLLVYNRQMALNNCGDTVDKKMSFTVPGNIYISAQQPDFTIFSGGATASCDEGRELAINVNNIKGPIIVSPTDFNLGGPPCPEYNDYGERIPAIPPPNNTEYFSGTVKLDPENIPAPGTSAEAEFSGKDWGYWTVCSAGQQKYYPLIVTVKFKIYSILLELDKKKVEIKEGETIKINITRIFPAGAGDITWRSEKGNVTVNGDNTHCDITYKLSGNDVVTATLNAGKTSYSAKVEVVGR